jgi:hypothetical protein
VFINPYLTPYVWIRMKHSQGSFAQLFFVTEADPVWQQQKSTFFPIIPDGEYHDYFINLLQAGAKTVVTQLRLDPTLVGGATLAIDFVRLTDTLDPGQGAPEPLPLTPLEITFTSSATEDGQVLESLQNAGSGGSRDSTGTTFRIGDDASNRAYRTVLSFDTSTLPDGATVTEATLGITRVGSITGTVPIGVPAKAFGDILVDVITGSFGGNAALENGDWQAAATKTAVSKFAFPAYSDLMTIHSRLELPDLGLINKLGRTQFRIRYGIDDDNDAVADYVSYGTGNQSTASRRPTLRIRYLTNRPPVFASNPVVATAIAGSAFSSQLTAIDPDAGDVLAYSKVAGPAWLSVSPSGTLSGTPGQGEVGPNSFTARASDADGGTDYATLEIQVLPNPDANENGMLDTWEIAMFGSAGPAAHDPFDDPDGDGLVNIAEYALNTHPLKANSNPVLVDFATIGPDKYLRLTAPRNPAASNLTTVVEASGEPAAGIWTAQQTLAEEVSANQLRVRDTVSVSVAPRRFLRLRIQVNP